MELKEEREETSGKNEKNHMLSKLSVHSSPSSSRAYPSSQRYSCCLCKSLVKMLTRQTSTDSRVFRKDGKCSLFSYLLTVRIPLDVRSYSPGASFVDSSCLNKLISLEC